MKLFFIIMLISVVTGLSFCTIEIRLDNASGSTYTKVAESIVWSRAQISTVDNVTYTFTINISRPLVDASDNPLRDDESTQNQSCICMNSSCNTVPSNTFIEDTFCSALNSSQSSCTTTYCSNINNPRYTVSRNFERNLSDDCYLPAVNCWSLRGLVTIDTRQGENSNNIPPSISTASLNFTASARIYSMFGVTAGSQMAHCC